MATKKNNPNVQKRVAERKAFVAARPNLSKETARKRFYVQTRAAELEAAGKTVDRAALRKKFETGTIKRAGFQTAQDIQKAAARRSAAASASAASIPAPSTTGRMSESAMMGQRRKAVSGFKSGNVQRSSITPKKQGNADRLAGAVGRGIVGGIKAQPFLGQPLRLFEAGKKEGLKGVAKQTFEDTVNIGMAVAGARGVGVAGKTPLGRAATSRIAKSKVGQFVTKLFAETKPAVKPPLALGPGPRVTPMGPVKPPLALGPGPRALPTGRPIPAARTAAGRARADAAFKNIREFQKEQQMLKIDKKVAEGIAKASKPVRATTKKSATKTTAKATTKKATAKKATAKKAPAAKAQKPVAKKAAPQPIKATAKKAASPKASAPVKAPATKSSKIVTSTGRSSTSAGRVKPVRAQAPSTTRRFGSQAEYNKFMDRGGNEALRRMSTQEQQAFTQLNRGWIIGRSRATQAQARSRAAAEELRRRAIASRNKNMASRARKKGLTFTE